MKWKISKEYEQMLLKDYLHEIRGFSKRTLAAVKHRGGKILVNGQEKTVRHLLIHADIVEVIFPPEERSNFIKPQCLPIDIVYEDDDVLVINKPPYIATIPSHHHPSHTIANAVLHHYDQQRLPNTIHVVTRLDRDTSGLLLIAKHRHSHSILFHDQQSGKINRTYSAVVTGECGESGTIVKPIGRAKDSIIKRQVELTGQPAVTHYQLIRSVGSNSLVDVQLETGRTHQIRVHFSYIGHPLLGDSLYGGDTSQLKRQALHCHSLSFLHPLTKKELTFNQPLPRDILQFINLTNNW